MRNSVHNFISYKFLIHDQIQRKIGFPTLNIKMKFKILIFTWWNALLQILHLYAFSPECVNLGTQYSRQMFNLCINPTWTIIPRSKLHGYVVSTSTPPNDTKPNLFILLGFEKKKRDLRWPIATPCCPPPLSNPLSSRIYFQPPAKLINFQT